MSEVPTAATIVEGHVRRKTSNALKMSFRDGTTEGAIGLRPYIAAMS